MPELLSTGEEEHLRFLGTPLAEQDLGHVVAQLRTHPDVLQRIEQPEAALRILEGAREITRSPKRYREPLIDPAEGRHIHHILSRSDGRLVAGDRFPRLA